MGDLLICILPEFHRLEGRIKKKTSDVKFYCFSSPLKHYQDRHKKAFKQEWLTTPNAYKKEEIDEVGTPNPKKITKVRSAIVSLFLSHSDLRLFPRGM